MIRLSGTSLISGVLVGADKSDESLGLTLPSDADRIAVPGHGLGSAGAGFVTVDEGPGAGPSGGR
jgi:hypothetical protein